MKEQISRTTLYPQKYLAVLWNITNDGKIYPSRPYTPGNIQQNF